MSARSVDDAGSKTVGMVGLAPGGVCCDKESGLAIRVECAVRPLLSKESVNRARALVSRGETHAACGLIQHEDASTVDLLLRAVEGDAECRKALSDGALHRLSLSADSLMDAPFFVERCGESVDERYVGRRFESGMEFFEETDVVASYAMIVDEEERWLSLQEVECLAAVRRVDVAAVLSAPTGTVERWPLQHNSSISRKFRLLENAADEKDVASLVICVRDEAVSNQDLKEESYADTHLTEGRRLFSRRGACRVSIYASQLSKALCRGRALSGSASAVLEPFQALALSSRRSAVTGESGLCVALRIVTCTSLVSSSPWRRDDDEMFLSVASLASLWLSSYADRRLRLSPTTLDCVRKTALGLWARDDPGALWPWRGWRDKEKLVKSLDAQFRDADADAIRLILRLKPKGLARAEAVAFTRILAVFTTEPHRRLLPLVKILPGVEDKPLLAAETKLGAYDHSLRPSSFLVVLQAALPFPPSSPDQHSLRALAELVHRLSSGLNSRAARQCLSTADTSRFTSFVDAKIGEEDAAMMDATNAVFPDWQSTSDAVRLTKAEQNLLELVRSTQTELRDALEEEKEETCLEKNGFALRRKQEPTGLKWCGRQPTPLERRTAFLMAFGGRHEIRVGKKKYYAMLIGDSDHPVVAQPRQFSGGADEASDSGSLKYVEGKEREAASEALAALLTEGIDVTLAAPPLGFRWKKTNCRVSWNGKKFFVDKAEIPSFDGISLLDPCGSPRESSLPPQLLTLIERAFYSSQSGDVGLLRDLDAASRRADDDAVYAWLEIAEKSLVPRAAWRDAFVKLVCRERGKVEISPCSRDGSRGGRHAVQQMTEGVVLRLFYACAALYPSALKRCAELAFRVDDTGPHFAHLYKTMSILAFGNYDDRSDFSVQHDLSTPTVEVKRKKLFASTPRKRKTSPHFLPSLLASSEDDQSVSEEEEDVEPAKKRQRLSLNLGALPDGGHGTLYAAPWRRNPEEVLVKREDESAVETTLWKHQREARDRVVAGIKSGKRGFADASAVGSGKTLTALAICVEVSKLLSTRSGCLVLCPTNSLIAEWCQQAQLHTSGLEIVVQRANGALISKGTTGGSETNNKKKKKSKTVELGPQSLVITTLARHREHPFVNQPGWDFVVVDECLSVQSESARQAAEAWRSVAASRGGVLLLSATLFRSSFSALFYLVSMMRSPLPRTVEFLPALLKEHCVCFVPESPRSWKLRFAKVPLDDEATRSYRARLDAFAAARVGRGAGTPRELYVALKSFLRQHFEPKTLVEEVKRQVEKLVKTKRKVLVFANTEREAERFVDALAGAERYDPTRSPTVIVLTVAEGAQGLNLQRKADCIVCRPQPGDCLEQMKGRIDRPGQTRRSLDLVVVVAQGTIEEAEGANIKLCGHFFRQYLDPLAVPFQERAVEASLQAATNATTTVARAFSRVLDHGLSPSSANDDDNSDDEEDEMEASAATIVPQKPSSPGNNKTKKAVTRHPQKPIKFYQSTTKPHAKLTAASMEVALRHLSRVDDRLAALIAQVGPPTSMLESIPAAFSDNNTCWRQLIRSVVYQQMSTTVAQTIFARLEKACGGTLSPRNILDLDPVVTLSPKMGGVVGLSRTKADYVRGISALFDDGTLSDKKLQSLDDEALMKTLIQVRGIGEWSVHMFLMFSLGRPDVLPVGDLAVQKAFKKLYSTNARLSGATDVNELPTRSQMEQIAENWRPWRTVGSWYMWHVVETASANWV